MASSIDDYGIYGTTKEKAEPLHDLVVEYKDMLFKSHTLQNLLFNRGYEIPENERPHSFFDIRSAVFNRTKTMVHMMYFLSGLLIPEKEDSGSISVTEDPSLIRTDFQMIIPVERVGSELDIYNMISRKQTEDEAKVFADAGHDFYKTLSMAFDEFNLQFMLTNMHRCQENFLYGDCEEEELQERILETFEHEAFNEMDNAYYNKGNQYLSSAGPAWKYLQDSDLGRMLTLTPEKEKYLMTRILG